MGRYVLVVDNREPIDVMSLKPGDPLTCSASFVSLKLDEQGNPCELSIDTHCGSSYGQEDKVETLILKLGQKKSYTYTTTDITGPTDWEDDVEIHRFRFYEETDKIAFSFELSDDRKGYLCTGVLTDGKELTIPSLHEGLPVIGIGRGAFADNKLLRRVSMSGSIRIIDSYAFARCENLEEVALHPGLETISYGAFSDCKNLHQIDLPYTLKELGEEAFADAGLRSICIPRNVKKVGNKAFSYCPLTNIVIKEGVEELGAECFEQTDAKRVKLPRSMKKVSPSAFRSIHVELEYPGTKEELTFQLKDLRNYFSYVSVVHCIDGDVTE